MAKKADFNYSEIDASPVKSFFVSMLTRDIRLEEAILDLLDNCVDGILRNETHLDPKFPYKGFKAEIDFDKSSFSIHDNCGGIPWSLHEYAFRMGRDSARGEDTPGTVGVYGIGMKRAIFKMGQEALISTQNNENRYEVEINSDWLADEKNWSLPVRQGEKFKTDGTTIVIDKLHKGVSTRFGDEKKEFSQELERMVSTHYSFIINKGFEVKINGKQVKPHPTQLIFSKKPSGKNAATIRPFIWSSKINGVSVFLSVGFTRPLPSPDELDADNLKQKYTSIDAGWTVVCNDRAVLYCDRTELTGWGEANIPRFHNQFIAISGIVEFKSNNASDLPTTTTKRGIDGSSRLYLQVKNKMREGTRLFIDYTNKWKDKVEESKSHLESEEVLTFDEIKKEAKKLKFSSSRNTVNPGSQFVPNLPKPKKEVNDRRISFQKNNQDIQIVSEYLFKELNRDPSEIGEKCFDIVLKEAKQ